MCGIFACTGRPDAVPVVIAGLEALEYRGYDSAGVAALTGNRIQVLRKEGKIARLKADAGETIVASAAIGHTRWATHGRPSDDNAHPHTSCSGDVAVVHNGIVENHAPLRENLTAAGHRFTSETDSEVIAHLLEDSLQAGHDLLGALRMATDKLHGSHAIAACTATEPDTVVAARIGNAGGIVLGFGAGANYLASDLPAILPHTHSVGFLSDRQFARITPAAVEVVDADGEPVAISRQEITFDPERAAKEPYEHFMLKEIMEQPEALSDTVHSLVSIDPLELRLDGLALLDANLESVQRVVLIGMGTSLHAAMIGRHYIERIAGIAAEADNASEFRYRAPVLGPDSMVVSVSQSGETVDVLEAMAIARDAHALQVTICNTEGGQTTRVADGTVYTRAGLERGVASTKCYVTAVAALHVLSLRLAVARGRLRPHELEQQVAELAHLPDGVAQVLAQRAHVARVAERIADARNMLFLGRGLAFPVAMEGALKMKEISYIHAEGYAAGEMKHGPIALIDPEFVTVALAPPNALREKMVSNIRQIRARGGPVVSLIAGDDEEIESLSDAVLRIPVSGPWVEPVLASVALQLLAYEVAVARGCDIDQPRNLAKTVTVE